MLIKDQRPKLVDWDPRHVWLKIKISFILSSVAIIMTFGLNYEASDGPIHERIKSHVGRTIYGVTGFVSALYYAPISLYFSWTVDTQKLAIEMDDKDYVELNLERNAAIERGNILPQNKRKFDAIVSIGNNQIPAKIRLKGDRVEFHQDQIKWSVNIELKENSTLNANDFSLQHPKRRSYLASKIQLIIAEQHNLPTNKLEMVALSINGNRRGMFQLEERWGLHSARRELGQNTVVIKFDDSYINRGIDTPALMAEAYTSAGIQVVNQSEVQKSEELLSLAAKATNLLAGYRSGELEAEQVFEVEKTGLWLALGDLIGTWHGYSWGNLRLMYDPDRDRLIPLLWDMTDENHQATADNRFKNRLIRIQDSYMDPNGPFWRELLSNHSILESYIRNLDELTDSDYFEKLKSIITSEISDYLQSIKTEYPHISLNHEFNQIEKNRVYIRENIIEPSSPAIASINRTEKGPELQIKNGIQTPIKIVGIKTFGSQLGHHFFETPVLIERKPYGSLAELVTINLEPYNLNFDTSNFAIKKSLVVQLLGRTQPIEIPLSNIPLS